MGELSGGAQRTPAALETRYRRLPAGWMAAILVLSGAGLLLTIYQVFNLQVFTGVVLVSNRFLYLLMGLFLPQVFLLFPARAASPRGG